MNCTTCGHKILSRAEWDRLPEDERAGIRIRVLEQCRRCYDRERRTRERTTWKLTDLIEEAEFLFAGGTDVRQVAFRLGLKPESLVRQYKRAHDRGLTERVLTYRRTSE